MKKIKLFLIFFCALFCVSCNTSKNTKPSIVSTIGMINDIVIEIGGDKVNARALMGPGVDPHLYRASAGDIKTLNKADLILYNGLYLEAKMIDIFTKLNKQKPTRAVTKNIPNSSLLSSEEYDGFPDPHVWFDVTLWKLATQEVTKALIEIQPQHKKEFKKNEAIYLKKLTELDHWIKEQISLIPSNQRILVTAHDAFGYFGKRYQIKVVGLQGISTKAEANTKDIQNITKIIINNKVPTIFIESSVPVKQIEAVQAAANAKGYSVSIGTPLFTDAMGDKGTPEGSYIGMIKHNVNSIRTGLK